MTASLRLESPLPDGTFRVLECHATEALSELGEMPLSFIYIDIDHFKRVNDGHGHPMGDEVLKHMVSELLRHCDSLCRLVRWGGEEFVLVCLHYEEARAAALAERLRGALDRDALEGALCGLCPVAGGAGHHGVVRGGRAARRAAGTRSQAGRRGALSGQEAGAQPGREGMSRFGMAGARATSPL